MISLDNAFIFSTYELLALQLTAINSSKSEMEVNLEHEYNSTVKLEALKQACCMPAMSISFAITLHP